MNNYYLRVVPASTIELLRRCMQKVPPIAGLMPALFLLGGMSGAQAALMIDSATWDGKNLVVNGTDGAGGTVSVYYGHGTPPNSNQLGTASVKRNGVWRLQVKSNRKTPLDPVPCAVSATLDGEVPVENFPVAGADPGTCAPQPTGVCNIAVNPTTLAFGSVTEGNSPALSSTVNNTGTVACNVSLQKTGSSDFAITSGSIFNIAPDDSANVAVSYTPGEAGADTGTLAVNSDDPDTPVVNVELTGTGVPQQMQECNLSVSPTILAFGDVTVGNSPAMSTTVSNTGSAPCNVSLQKSGSSDFAITSATNFSVIPGDSTNVSVSYTPGQAGADAGTVAVNSNDPDMPAVNVDLTGNGLQQQGQCDPANPGVSINSTSQDGCPEQRVGEQSQVLDGTHRVLAINDLGMHCGDLDTRISSILPPFQVLLGQVILRGDTPTLNPVGVNLEYSAASNPNDPILGQPGAVRGLKDDGSTYKTNFWDAVAGGSYDAFYPGGLGITPLASGGFPVTPDVGLPVPNVEELYIGADGIVDQPGGSNDGTLTAVQHAMPGLAAPYLLNEPVAVEEHYGDKPFFVNFPFGYVAENVNWHEGAGIPFTAYDDFGRENAYPLVRVEAKQGPTTVATVDTVLPISGEASCTNCHSDPTDVQNSRTGQPTGTLTAAGLPVALSLDDPDQNLPTDVSVEYAADINILRLHDLKHGANYVDTAGDSTPCDVTANGGSGDSNCLINQALVQGQPVVCQVCHYTPALDLAQVGPVAGPPGTPANGRNQLAHPSNSNVMHSHHGSLGNLFPKMPAPVQANDGTITNQAARLAVLENTCYQCHPGTNVQCLRGAMFNGGMLCNDCHGDMEQVGADFSQNVSPSNPGAFVLDQGNFYDPGSGQPRVPWANEPGCGSCHTGDSGDNLAALANTIVNTRDVDGNVDNLRLRQAYVSGDPKATPIVPTNKRFAEPAVPASFNGFDNPGAGNPQLYRVSTGHGGVMCEGCHGATHAEWPNANPASNDNVTADQLQGHIGAIVECGTCHTNVDNLSPDGSSTSLRGPHGLHAVGDTNFARGEHRRNRVNEECRACHGQSGEGTVLSRVAEDRVLECKDETAFCPNGNSALFPKGHAVGCVECHSNKL